MKISIALPTKNRQHMVLESITHALAQTHSDLELVIADNSTSEDTANLVEGISDSRIKYIRTGGLSMSDNWEAAMSASSGELVYIIGDKILLKPDALQKLASFAETKPSDIYTFLGNPNVKASKKNSLWQEYSTESLVQSALRGDISSYQNLGFHGYSLVVSRDLFTRLKQKHAKVILPISPDYTLAYMASLNTNTFYHFNWCSFEYCYKASSNGFSSAYEGPLFQQFLRENKSTIEAAVENVPIKIYTIWNSVLSDFFTVYKANGHLISHDLFDLPKYWKRLFDELVHYSTLTHIDMSHKFTKLYEYMETAPSLQTLEIGKYIENNRLATQGFVYGNRMPLFRERVVGKLKRLMSKSI